MFEELRMHAANARQVRAAGLESYVDHLLRMLQQADDPADEVNEQEPGSDVSDIEGAQNPPTPPATR